MSTLEANLAVNIEDIENQPKKYYRSKVLSVGATEVELLAPMEKSVLVPLRVGSTIEVSFHDDNAVYQFQTVILKREGGEKQTLIVEKPEKIKRTQRRNFVRLDVRQPITYLAIDDDLNLATEEHEGTTLDISGGGLRFESTANLESGTELNVVIDLDNLGTVNAFGKVVRSIPKEEDKFMVGFQFTLIEEKDRDKIIKFIFQKQIELRQRGLL